MEDKIVDLAGWKKQKEEKKEKEKQKQTREDVDSLLRGIFNDGLGWGI